jgi:hypothetical protein
MHADAAKFSDAARVWTCISRIFPGLEDRIAGRLENINRSTNLVTAYVGVHRLLGSFKLALEPVAVRDPNYTSFTMG